MRFLLCFILFTSITVTNCWSQKVVSQPDTVQVIDDLSESHSPRKATFLSLAVPGLGQAYNKKYWKIPLVYAIIGVPLYFAIDQQDNFNDFKDSYLARVDDDPTTTDDKYDGVYTDDKLLSLIDYHRKNRDLLYVLTGVAYALNVLDAAVDAHLYYFDVGDDLTASIRPTVQMAPNQQLLVPSLTFSLKFTKKSHRNPF